MNFPRSVFTPQAMQNKIAPALGYNQQPYDESGFHAFLEQNPAAKAQYDRFQQGALQMAKGGLVFNTGGDTGSGGDGFANNIFNDIGQIIGSTLPHINSNSNPTDDGSGNDSTDPPDTPYGQSGVDLKTLEADRLAGTLPETATVQTQQIPVTPEQQIAAGTGQVAQTPPTAAATSATASQATATPQTPTATVEAQQASPEVQQALNDTNAEQGIVNTTIEAAQQGESAVSNLSAAVGEGVFLNNQITREIQNGEIISAAANAEKAAKFMEIEQAATADPSRKAMVKGQLEDLYADFDADIPPPWAAGAMRAATAAMAARGLVASSMAGQAVIQATMESALPIAAADAQTVATFEITNLSNRQQRAMLAAQQRAAFLGQEFDQQFQSRVANAARVSDVANLNFTAEQQIQLENSRIANSMNLQNLNNKQAMTMAEAASLANLDMANLNNRQQAAVQNAQNFLQMDMANLSARQQMAMFDAQASIQSIFTDTAAQNAAQQFNATSENQLNQFFAQLSTQTSQFNAAQSTAISQFNAGQTTAIDQFNKDMQNQRDQFNAQNSLVIAQSNAQWRRQIATADTVAVNRANELNAQAALGMSNTAYNNVQQYMRDLVFRSILSGENALDREQRIISSIYSNNSAERIASMQADAAGDAAFLTSIVNGASGVVSAIDTASKWGVWDTIGGWL